MVLNALKITLTQKKLKIIKLKTFLQIKKLFKSKTFLLIENYLLLSEFSEKNSIYPQQTKSLSHRKFLNHQAKLLDKLFFLYSEDGQN